MDPPESSGQKESQKGNSYAKIARRNTNGWNVATTTSPVDFAGLLPDLTASCADSNCHDSASPAGGLTLLSQADFDSNAVSINNRINRTPGSAGYMPRASAANPSGSYVPANGSTRTATVIESDLKAYIASVLNN